MRATIHQAKTNLSRLIQKALDGEEVIIANRNTPIVRLEPLEKKTRRGRIGGLKHWRSNFGKDFNHPKLNREIERQFEERARK